MKHFWWAALFLSVIGCSPVSESSVGVQPYATFNAALANTVANTLKQVYGCQVEVLPPIEIPKSTFINQKSPRYRADQLIRILRDTKPDTLDYVLGLIEKDISTTKKDTNGETRKPISKYQDWGVFGLGYRPGESCIVSTFRFKKTSNIKFIDRLKKISTHELGHNLGLKHCPSKKCVMTDAAESIKTIDAVNLALCQECTDQLQW